MGNVEFPKVGQGAAVIASAEDIERDNVGFTHPNLHRRIDPQQPPEDSQEYRAREYKLGISSVNSYRTTKLNYHDENSDKSEIP